jgi:uncharacterized protein
VQRFAGWTSVALLGWNNLVHLLPGAGRAYVPLNVAASVVIVVTARRCGLSWSDLGLRLDRLRSGTRWGGAVAAATAGAFVVAAVVPSLRPLLDDARVRRLEPGGVAYHALVRIPFGTVLLEELAFRGVLFGALVRVSSPARAAVLSSTVFGLWHVRPTLGLLSANDITTGAIARGGTVAAAVAFTSMGGLFFCLLRLRSDSLVAPIIAHIATNSLGVVASAATR